MAGRPLQAGSAPGAVENLIQAFRRQRFTSSRALQYHEYPIGARRDGSFLTQIIAEGIEETVRNRHHPVMPALALDDERAPIGNLDVSEPQPEHLAAAQSTEQH